MLQPLLYFLCNGNPIFHQTPLTQQHYHLGTKISFNAGHCEQLSEIEPVQMHRLLSLTNPVTIESRIQQRPNGRKAGEFWSVYGLDDLVIKQRISQACKTVSWYMEEKVEVFKKKPERGDPKNRIDVVFMGDGYTLDQKDLFESDIKRLVNDMWSGSTFESFLPLFNIWAVFVPSKESGIGIGGKAKKTVFGLYRDGTELRGIYTSKPEVARRVCKLVGPMACDYPSLIGNDDYYGGLGGEFVISTKSKTSGTVVLRHEMGHNFVDVGEEYDGGQVYSGVNAARSLAKLGWKEWLSEPSQVREEVVTQLVQDYSWYDLAKGEYLVRFASSGTASSWKLQISTSGMEVDGALQVKLDGMPLNWTSSGTLDRTFTVWTSDSGLPAGYHELTFTQGLEPATPSSPIRQLCSVTMHEYGNESLFRKDNTFIGAYPTWDLYGQKTYRPTNEGCLMRDMQRNSFCPGAKY